ncbi:Stp1/IreP family PP2C-type Ser/Thr phosphatase [Pseudalkalibacillus berkeleyi]|uniref:Stp1/IreP family PP2C-type Ser/Thr phosphatase n=1 Tax=Pseudalkalibacillus berkeleyi TaxID=1069813 RepID=A0ABS9GW76_9BACL|nr:Stp1/IreP family PP2C-type Ser/Thr phosphatase [Pseudalkalibacillus berkeleyi]MCF6137057.1 Stp1/IreP family PP2C-type Ser/Thr phosphatase [Pseudalkalibacillus berkeleyi]
MLKAFFQTDQGKVRAHNEDNGAVIHISASDVFAVVADGMGGHNAGDVASQMAVNYMNDHLHTYMNDHDDTKSTIHSLIEGANNNIYSYAEKNPECRGMGTTIVIVRANQSELHIGHVGDSRCYKIEGSTITQLTDDHTLVNELVKSGQITHEEAEYHPRRHVVLRALGTDPSVDIDDLHYEWQSGDYLLLCSDGLSNKVSNQSIVDVVTSSASLEDKGNQLVSMANEAGGEDNITLILLYNDDNSEEGASQ